MDAPRSTRQVFDPVAIGLVTVALVASLGLVGPLVRPSEVPVMVAGTIALLGYRIWLLTHPGDVPARRLGFWLGLPIQAVLVYISPIFGLAAFLGYIESPPSWRKESNATSDWRVPPSSPPPPRSAAHARTGRPGRSTSACSG